MKNITITEEFETDRVLEKVQLKAREKNDKENEEKIMIARTILKFYGDLEE